MKEREHILAFVTSLKRLSNPTEAGVENTVIRGRKTPHTFHWTGLALATSHLLLQGGKQT